jgi:hypothetical protein
MANQPPDGPFEGLLRTGGEPGSTTHALALVRIGTVTFVYGVMFAARRLVEAENLARFHRCHPRVVRQREQPAPGEPRAAGEDEVEVVLSAPPVRLHRE